MALVCLADPVEQCGNDSVASLLVLSIVLLSWSSGWELAAQLQFGYCANLLGELRLSAATESLLHLGQITAKSVVGSPTHIGHLCDRQI